MNNIDSLMLKRMIVSAANNLQNNRRLIIDYNVFPVPASAALENWKAL